MFAIFLTVASATTLAATEINRLWYSLPLIVAVSLVYAATRHEAIRPILEQAVRFAIWIVVFMAIIAAILQFFTWRL